MPAGVFFAEAIEARLLSPAEVRIRILTTMQKYERSIKKDFQRTTETWVDHNPVFTSKIRFARGDVRLKVATNDEVYGYLNSGTSHRWAVMSRDFLPKTTPNVLKSFPGRGGTVLRGRNAMVRHGFKAPMPGIEPRDWTGTIKAINRADFSRDIKDAVRRGLRAARKKGKK